MEHVHAAAAREALIAFGRGDPGPTEALLAEDIVLINHDLAAEAWHRIEGRAAVLDFFGQFDRFLDGTFSEEIVDALATEAHLVLLVHETGRKDGVEYDNRAVYVIELRAGRWARMETFDRDRGAVARFWDTVGTSHAVLGTA